MRAALYDSYGPPDVLYVGEVPVPALQRGEVLVRVHAASVNGGELYGRAGRLRLLTGRTFPKRTGIDFAGEVAEVDPAVTGLRPGARVWGVLPRTFGSAAEFVAVRPRNLAYAPENLGLVEAASLPVGTTAITALRTKAGLKAGERLLVRGAAGGVGSIAVQLGKALGAHVTGLAGTKNLDLVRELGADEAHSYATTGPSDLGRFDVIMDTVGTELRSFRGSWHPGAAWSPSPSTSTTSPRASATCWPRRPTAGGVSASSAATRPTTCSPNSPGTWRAAPSARSWTPSTRSPESPQRTGPWRPAAYGGSM